MVFGVGGSHLYSRKNSNQISQVGASLIYKLSVLSCKWEFETMSVGKINNLGFSPISLILWIIDTIYVFSV